MKNILKITETEEEALFHEDLIQRIIETEDITVEIEEENGEEITKGRFF